jgi:thiol peroxidase
MAAITLHGKVIHTSGMLPAVGSKAPHFVLTRADLTDVSLKDFLGKKIVLNIFPSLDTGVCAVSVRRFNKEAVQLRDTVVLCISADLPFAHKRFCETEGIANVVNLSDMRNKDFGKLYGVAIIDGPLAGLLSRAVAVLDEQGIVKYTEQVPKIEQEPDYETALSVIDRSAFGGKALQ